VRQRCCGGPGGRERPAGGDGRAKIGDGTAEPALGELLAARDLVENPGAFAVLDQDDGHGLDGVGVLGEGGDAGIEEFGFHAEVAAHEPMGEDNAIEEVLFGGGLGVELILVIAREGQERLGIFAGEDKGLGVEPELGGVFAGDGLAFRGAGAGRLPRVGNGSGDLGRCSHRSTSEMKWGRPGRDCPSGPR